MTAPQLLLMTISNYDRSLFGTVNQIIMRMTLFKTPVVLLAVLSVTACKDDPGLSLPTETVLSKEFRDGTLVSEYKYNSDKQLEQILGYDESTEQLEYFVKFEYDARGYLQQHIVCNADGKATSRTQYQIDPDGKFISSEFITLAGADSGKVIIRHTYEYNSEGYLSKDTWQDPDTEVEESYRVYFYYPNGNLERYEYYWTLVPAPEKAFEVRYSPAGQPLAESVSRRRGYPMNFDLYPLVAEQIQYETFDTAYGASGEYHKLITGRMYDSEGFVTEQTMTYNYILPANPDEVIKVNYTYIKI